MNTPDPNIKVLNVLVAYKDNKTYVYTTHTYEWNKSDRSRFIWNRDIKPRLDAEMNEMFYITCKDYDDASHLQRVWNEVAHPWIKQGFATFNGIFHASTLKKCIELLYSTFNDPDRINKRINIQKKINSCIPYPKSNGYVYCMKITNGTNTRYKIGMTDRDPLTRMSELFADYITHGYIVSLEDYNTTSDSIGDEGRLHMLCSKYKSDPIIKKEDSRAAYDKNNSELFNYVPEVHDIWENYWR